MYGDSFDDDSIKIEQLTDGKFRSELSVPSRFYGSLIGTRGVTKMKLEKETNSRIHFPRMGEQGNIIITSFSHKNVFSAAKRIEMIVMEAKKKIGCTHFCR